MWYFQPFLIQLDLREDHLKVVKDPHLGQVHNLDPKQDLIHLQAHHLEVNNLDQDLHHLQHRQDFQINQDQAVAVEVIAHNLDINIEKPKK